MNRKKTQSLFGDVHINAKEGRRNFVKTCLATASAVAANPALLAYAEPLKSYSRSLLTDQNGNPFTSQTMEQDKAYIFHYPYVTTPCFLINTGKSLSPGHALSTENEGSYTWQGGSGPNHSIVSFSAICAHKLSYPTKTLSFLNYRPESVQFVNAEQTTEQRKQLIYCCSERSAYDPAKGAEVVGGPARQPLAAIELEYDAALDQFYAVGTRGGELYSEFFEKFGFRLALDHKITDVQTKVGDNTAVYPHSEYSQHAVAC